MKIFEKLELLGFFIWLDQVHNLIDTDMKPSYLDELPLDDIHRTVVNAMAFRWFREKGFYCCINPASEIGKYHVGFLSPSKWELVKDELGLPIKYTHEEAELVCIDKLIELLKK